MRILLSEAVVIIHATVKRGQDRTMPLKLGF